MNRQQREKERQRKREGRMSTTRRDNEEQRFQLLCSLIGNSQTEIPDDVINGAINLMKAYATADQREYIGYYTPAQLHLYCANSTVLHKPPVPSTVVSINIHPVHHHWITSCFNFSATKVTVYDSLKNPAHLREVFPQLRLLYGSAITLTSIEYPDVTQQSTQPICGVMAIAFAFSLYLKQDPMTVNYNIHQARHHLRLCFNTGQILPFPGISHSQPAVNSKQMNENKTLHEVYPALSLPPNYQIPRNQNDLSFAPASNSLQEVEFPSLNRSTIDHTKPGKNANLKCEQTRCLKSNLTPTEALGQQKNGKNTKQQKRNAKNYEEMLPGTCLHQTKRKSSQYKEKKRTCESPLRCDKHSINTMRKKRKSNSPYIARESNTRKEKGENVDDKNKQKRDTIVRRSTRNDCSYKTVERSRESLIRKCKQKPHLFKDAEIEREGQMRKWENITYKNAEIDRESQIRKRKRKNILYKDAEIERESQMRKHKRKKIQYKDAEIERESQMRKHKRKKIQYKDAEIERESQMRKHKRKNILYKDAEIERESQIRKHKRKNISYKEVEIERESQIRKHKRKNISYKEVEIERESQIRKCKRKKIMYKDAEINRETPSRKTLRKDPTRRSLEREQEQHSKKKSRRSADIEKLIRDFHLSTSDGPLYVCTSCHQLWYKHSVLRYSTTSMHLSDKVLKVMKSCATSTFSAENIEWLCRTCHSHLKKGNIPPLSVKNKVAFKQQGVLKDLNPLELTLLAGMLPFMKIHQAPRGNQYRLTGNMVLVPSDVPHTVSVLPRLLSETATIKAKLKRRLCYKHHVYSLNVRPEKIRQGAKFLSGKHLYKSHNIVFNENWESYEEPLTNEPIMTDDTPHSNQTKIVPGSDPTIDPVEMKSLPDDDEAWSEIDESEIITGMADTMLTAPDFIEPSERDFVYNFAPGEGNIPVSVFLETHAEELAFPGIFCGEPRPTNRERSIPTSYGEIVKAELRNKDRRAATCVENIFFKAKKIQMKSIIDQTTLAVRKIKTKGQKLTAKDVRGHCAQNLVHTDKAYKFMSTIRGSPPYFQAISKDLFAMIRQLGPATFFTSFSAAETRWLHLLRTLGKLIDCVEYSQDELENLNWQDKCRLIQSDPVTCARHFDYVVRRFITDFLLSEAAPLGKLSDYFLRIEFQQRGSPHVHMLVWCAGAPQYGTASPSDITEFIDRYITCSKPNTDDDDTDLVNLQIHRHTHTCKKKGRERVDFPTPNHL